MAFHKSKPETAARNLALAMDEAADNRRNTIAKLEARGDLDEFEAEVLANAKAWLAQWSGETARQRVGGTFGS